MFFCVISPNKQRKNRAYHFSSFVFSRQKKTGFSLKKTCPTREEAKEPGLKTPLLVQAAIAIAITTHQIVQTAIEMEEKLLFRFTVDEFINDTATNDGSGVSTDAVGNGKHPNLSHRCVQRVM